MRRVWFTGLILLGACASDPHAIDHLRSDDPRVRAEAEAALVRGGRDSLAVLRRPLKTRDEELHAQAFEILRQIGPDSIPLLTEALGYAQVSVRREAVSSLIDLAPDTESIQPALCRALTDSDPLVARDAARALGALGEKAGPSV